MFKIRFISMLVLLCLTVSGAWAQEERLLTTILSADNTSFKSGSKTFDNIATVTFSGEVWNDVPEWGWYHNEERTLTVTAVEGYTITRVKFYTNNSSAFDEQAPFEAILVYDGATVTKVNGTSIGIGGVTKIEVYGYGTPTYRVSLKGGTEDATSWQGKAGEGEYQALPLKRVAAGTAVSLKYSGWKLVKSVKAKKVKAAAEATAEDKGKLICTDGHIHAYGEDAECTKARVAKIIYIGPTGHDTYTHGLALALTDEGWMTWWAARDACSAKNTSTPVTDATWLLASFDQWGKMITAAGGYTALRDGFSSVGGSNLQSGPQGLYWSSTEYDSGKSYEAWCYVFDDGHWGYNHWLNDCRARACLAFGAQETVTLNHSANNTWAQETVTLNHSANNAWAQETVTLNHSANNTWTLAATPDSSVDLEVEYFNITVPTANTADIYIGSTTPLINAGSTTEDGATMKYLVTATNEQPTSTDGFSADVPTAQATAITGRGTYYVWYYLDFESGDDSDISALAVVVTVKAVHVTMNEGTLDADNWQGKAGTGEYQALPLTDLEPGTAVSVKYNGTKKVKSVKAKKKALNLTSPAVGQVIGDDGKNYDYASLPGGVTAVAKICYVSGSNGLALALTDEGKMNWSTAISTCAANTPAFTGGTWKLATQDEWNNMITAAGSGTALRDGFSSVGGSNLQSVGYWSSTEYKFDNDNVRFYHFDDNKWYIDDKTRDYYRVRACLAFLAQGSDPDPIELTSTDGKTWTLASMSYYDVKLEMEYYDEVTLTDGEAITDLDTYKGQEIWVNYTRSFTEGKTSTVCLPFAYTKKTGDGSFYAFTNIEKVGNDYVATMTEPAATTLEANTPYLYKAATTGDADFSGAYTIPASLTAGSTTSNGWTFKGTFTTIEWENAPTGTYGFSAQAANDGIQQGQFVKVGAYVRIKPMRAYLQYTGSGNPFAGVKALTLTSVGDDTLPETIGVRLISANGEVTAIGTLHTRTGEVSFDSEAWYTLDGKRLNAKPNTKGIYVNNGKKVVIK